jgi:PhnB protein
MKGPEGERHYARADYEKIVPFKNFSGLDSFCDENGQIVSDPPGMHWNCRFSESGGNTIVDVEITFKKESDLEKIIELGFKEGFTAALGNLDELLEHSSIKK